MLIGAASSFFNRMTLLLSYMFFLNSLLDIHDAKQSNKKQILRLGAGLIGLYLIETIFEIFYAARFCTGKQQ